jgi:hypothetical protein
LGMAEAKATERFDQHMGKRRKPKTELIGAHGRGRRAVGK